MADESREEKIRLLKEKARRLAQEKLEKARAAAAAAAAPPAEATAAPPAAAEPASDEAQLLAEAEKKRKEYEAALAAAAELAEKKKRQQEEEAAAAREAERKRIEDEAREAERKRIEDEAAALRELERKRLEEEAAAREAERKRLELEAAAREAERKRLEEEAAAREAERKRLEEEAAAREAQRKRDEEIAAREARIRELEAEILRKEREAAAAAAAAAVAPAAATPAPAAAAAAAAAAVDDDSDTDTEELELETESATSTTTSAATHAKVDLSTPAPPPPDAIAPPPPVAGTAPSDELDGLFARASPASVVNLAAKPMADGFVAHLAVTETPVHYTDTEDAYPDMRGASMATDTPSSEVRKSVLASGIKPPSSTPDLAIDIPYDELAYSTAVQEEEMQDIVTTPADDLEIATFPLPRRTALPSVTNDIISESAGSMISENVSVFSQDYKVLRRNYELYGGLAEPPTFRESVPIPVEDQVMFPKEGGSLSPEILTDTKPDDDVRDKELRLVCAHATNPRACRSDCGTDGLVVHRITTVTICSRCTTGSDPTRRPLILASLPFPTPSLGMYS